MPVNFASRPTPRHPFPSPFASPPPPSPGDPSVVPVFHPPNRRHRVQGAEHTPPAAQLPQHPAHPRGPLVSPPTLLDRPRRPVHLLARQAQRLDQAWLLVRAHPHPPVTIVQLHPAGQPAAEFALAVVHEHQPIVRHRPNLHSLMGWPCWSFRSATTSAPIFSSATS